MSGFQIVKTKVATIQIPIKLFPFPNGSGTQILGIPVMTVLAKWSQIQMVKQFEYIQDS
jgi:hypothetical protein